MNWYHQQLGSSWQHMEMSALSPIWSQPTFTPLPPGGMSTGRFNHPRKCFLGFASVVSRDERNGTQHSRRWWESPQSGDRGRSLISGVLLGQLNLGLPTYHQGQEWIIVHVSGLRFGHMELLDSQMTSRRPKLLPSTALEYTPFWFLIIK